MYASSIVYAAKGGERICRLVFVRISPKYPGDWRFSTILVRTLWCVDRVSGQSLCLGFVVRLATGWRREAGRGKRDRVQCAFYSEAEPTDVTRMLTTISLACVSPLCRLRIPVVRKPSNQNGNKYRTQQRWNAFPHLLRRHAPHRTRTLVDT